MGVGTSGGNGTSENPEMAQSPVSVSSPQQSKASNVDLLADLFGGSPASPEGIKFQHNQRTQFSKQLIP
ncbi:hypothetical protein G6F68_021716 [Rhizopus microsporus]|nr:hypothetical protein G6F68_021716 [Rhizopus microsporus]